MGEWRIENGEWGNGELRMENGEWGNGELRMGEWRMETNQTYEGNDRT